jgi:hypothetical protein
MPSAAISKYFDATENRNIRDDLIFAVDKVTGPKVAVDCGCGAGADIRSVKLSRSSFSQYEFPNVSLVVADASFFFCPKSEFPSVWEKVYDCLPRGGIFSGSFLGPDDTMASSKYNPDDFWPEVAVFGEDEVKKLFAKYQVLRFNEHRTSGAAPGGDLHDWHIYSVVAKKT